MKNKNILFIVYLLCSTITFAELGKNADIMVNIYSDRDSIYPCEPLAVYVTIDNHSESIVEEAVNRLTSFRVKKEGTNDVWKAYTPCGPQVTPLPPRKLKILPSQTIEDICLIHVGINNEPVFKDPGVYYVQVGTPFGESETIKITVNIPSSSIMEYEAILKNKLYVLFDEYTMTCMIKNVEELDKLSNEVIKLKNIADSGPYADWVPVCEYLIAKEKIKEMKDGEGKSNAIQALISEYSSIVHSLSSPQRESLDLAILAIKQKKVSKEKYKEDLKYMNRYTNSKYYKYMTKYLLEQSDATDAVYGNTSGAQIRE